EYVEDIEGDLMERFDRRLEEKENGVAKWGFLKDIIQLFRPGIIRPFTSNYPLNHYDMFKNNFKVASRSLLKHKFYSFINIAGLAIGMTCCLLIYLYVNHELSYDAFHTKKAQIHRIVTDIKTPTETLNISVTSAPMAAYMKKDFPEVLEMVRLDDADFLLTRNGQTFQEDNGMLVDASFFEVFSFPIISGDHKTALSDPFSIVLTEDAAKKYFGNEDPLGKVLSLEGGYDLTVTAVMQNVPENSNFTFNVLLPMSLRLEKLSPDAAEQWGNFGYQSYVLLTEHTQTASLEAKLPDFMEKYAGEFMKRNNMNYSLYLEPLTTIYLRSKRGSPKSGSLSNVIIFSIIAGFILLIACFNFMNLSTARATERAKEVGVRKVVGAIRWQLTLQFLCESLVMSILAFSIAIVASEFLLPAFNELSEKEIAISIFQNITHVLIFFIVSIVVGLLAGIYPALVLSKFKSVAVLKGRFSSSQKGIMLRRVLVVAQFVISIVLIAGTTIVYKQLSYMRQQALGFKQDQMMIIDFRRDDGVQEKIETFKRELTNNPNVLTISASSSVPSRRNNGAYTKIENPDGELQASNVDLFYVDHNFLDQYEMTISAGRKFSHDFLTDTTGLIVNEATVESYGYQSAEEIIGKRFSQWGVKGEIIGVVKDYHFQSLQEKIKPLTIRLEPTNTRYLSLNISTEDIVTTVASVEKEWQRLAPQRPFNYFFLDQSFNEQYKAEMRFGELFIYFACLAIFIACLGLLGLISYTIVQRTKEIGIRKVLGASKLSIIKLLTQDVVKLIIIAFFIALPIAWFSLSKWLENFAYQTDLSGWIFILAGLLVMSITLITISIQALKAALLNPVDSIKNE
ncbi:MAG: FtsX-like permease family protein, partial [Bacteroidota bacterium]